MASVWFHVFLECRACGRSLKGFGPQKIVFFVTFPEGSRLRGGVACKRHLLSLRCAKEGMHARQQKILILRTETMRAHEILQCCKSCAIPVPRGVQELSDRHQVAFWV